MEATNDVIPVSTVGDMTTFNNKVNEALLPLIKENLPRLEQGCGTHGRGVSVLHT